MGFNKRIGPDINIPLNLTVEDVDGFYMPSAFGESAKRLGKLYSANTFKIITFIVIPA
jgi:hypothetical protein